MYNAREIEARLVCPSGREVPCEVQKIDNQGMQSTKLSIVNKNKKNNIGSSYIIENCYKQYFFESEPKKEFISLKCVSCTVRRINKVNKVVRVKGEDRQRCNDALKRRPERAN